MAHKKCGVWKKPWFSVTWALIGKGHAASTPFQDASDIPKYVDEAKKFGAESGIFSLRLWGGLSVLCVLFGVVAEGVVGIL